MGWTLPDVWDLPVAYYDLIAEELTKLQAKEAGI